MKGKYDISVHHCSQFHIDCCSPAWRTCNDSSLSQCVECGKTKCQGGDCLISHVGKNVTGAGIFALHRAHVCCTPIDTIRLRRGGLQGCSWWEPYVISARDGCAIAGNASARTHLFTSAWSQTSSPPTSAIQVHGHWMVHLRNWARR